MWSEGELLIQCNSKVTNNRGKDKWGKSAAMADRSSFASCCRVPNQINLVFDGLNLKRLVDIQVSKTSKVLLIAKTAEVALETGQCTVGRPGCHRHTSDPTQKWQ